MTPEQSQDYRELEEHLLQWRAYYLNRAHRSYVVHTWTQITLIILAAVATVVAALSNADTISWSKPTLIFLTAGSAALGALVSQFKFTERPLKEATAGQDFWLLIEKLRSKRHTVKSDDDWRSLKQETKKRYREIRTGLNIAQYRGLTNYQAHVSEPKPLAHGENVDQSSSGKAPTS